MLKMICICDRCKKQFEAKQARRIIFEPTITQEETLQSKLVKTVLQALPTVPIDYCPECVAEIKDFMKSKKESDKEAAENEPE